MMTGKTGWTTRSSKVWRRRRTREQPRLGILLLLLRPHQDCWVATLSFRLAPVYGCCCCWRCWRSPPWSGAWGSPLQEHRSRQTERPDKEKRLIIVLKKLIIINLFNSPPHRSPSNLLLEPCVVCLEFLLEVPAGEAVQDAAQAGVHSQEEVGHALEEKRERDEKKLPFSQLIFSLTVTRQRNTKHY